jgi:hypothetical protein
LHKGDGQALRDSLQPDEVGLVWFFALDVVGAGYDVLPSCAKEAGLEALWSDAHRHVVLVIALVFPFEARVEEGLLATR